MIFAVGADHGGYPMNEAVMAVLEKAGHQVVDCGTHRGDLPDDYPDYAYQVGSKIQSGEAERGILVCGSGVGICVAANKMHGIHACLCHDTYSAHQGVEHDNINVLCLGARVIGVELALELVRTFAAARFTGEERHVRRAGKVDAIEDGTYQAP
jgi:ribose 5-phosphate isomerase B